MLEQSLQVVNDFLDRLFAYGPILIYVALFLAAFIENLFPPFPGDFFTLAGGAMAADGRLNVWVVFVLIYMGGIGSVMVLYYLGNKYGRSFFKRKNYRYFSGRDIDSLQRWFEKKGAWLLIFNRFLVGTRAALAFVVGISHYNPAKSFIFLSISFLLFNGLLLFSSYLFVANIDKISQYYSTYNQVVWPIVIAAIVLLIGYRIYHERKQKKSS
jgi:membrane protein DedA with SNARE-associated domain